MSSKMPYPQSSYKEKANEKLRTLAYRALNKSELRDLIITSLNTKKRISFALAQTVEDLKKVIWLRKEVFVKEERYPRRAVWNDLDRYAIHFLAKLENQTVGSISICIDTGTFLPVERLYGVNLSLYRNGHSGRFAEIQKLAVLPQYRRSMVSLGLMVTAYEFIKLCGAEKICIFTLSERLDNIRLYERFGFRRITEFPIFDSKFATCMILDIKQESFYEKLAKQRSHRIHLVRRLSQMLSFKLDPE